MNKRSIFIRFYLYQRMRFPILIIGLSLIPAILSSGVIVSEAISPIKVLAVLTISLLYLLHIRILDDRRDFNHDSLYHRSRPIQKGIITNKELWKIDLIITPLIILLAFPFGFVSSIVAVFLILYSFCAEKNFFIENTIKEHFFIYNFVNTFQTFVLQLFVYILFAETIPFTHLLLLHFTFTCIGTIIFEFVRKVKIPVEDGAGKDTYTWYLGFKKALIVFAALVGMELFLFLQIMLLITHNTFVWILFSLISFVVMLCFTYIYLRKQNHTSEVFAQIYFVMLYAVCNLIIFVSKF